MEPIGSREAKGRPVASRQRAAAANALSIAPAVIHRADTVDDITSA